MADVEVALRLPAELEGFAKDASHFLQCINEFPELTDDKLNEAIEDLDGNLKYWSSCLRLYNGTLSLIGI